MLIHTGTSLTWISFELLKLFNFMSRQNCLNWISDFKCHHYCCCSVAQLRLTLWDPMDCNMPGFPILHYLLESAQTHVHWVNDAIQPSHPLSPLSLPAFNLPQHQGFFHWDVFLFYYFVSASLFFSKLAHCDLLTWAIIFSAIFYWNVNQ